MQNQRYATSGDTVFWKGLGDLSSGQRSELSAIHAMRTSIASSFLSFGDCALSSLERLPTAPVAFGFDDVAGIAVVVVEVCSDDTDADVTAPVEATPVATAAVLPFFPALSTRRISAF